jgi:hypothetical protein
MEMVLSSIESDHLYEFYVKQPAPNYTRPMHNITYNTTDWTYAINGSTGKVIIQPSLQFPSLGLESYDPSMPFSTGGFYIPTANLVRCNASIEPGMPMPYARSALDATCSTVLETVTSSPSNCSQLKVCGMWEGTDDFQIALGVVMIEQFLHSLCCNGGCTGISNVGDIRWSGGGASSDVVGTFSDQELSMGGGNSSLCPTVDQITSIGTCSWGLAGLGLCECPELQADPDIGGLGVISTLYHDNQHRSFSRSL